jgi:hypothetical protein
VSDVAAGSDRLWLSRTKYVTSTSSSGNQTFRQETSIETLTGVRAGKFASASSMATKGGALIPQRDGTRFAINGQAEGPPRITVFETSDATQPSAIFDTAGGGFATSYATSIVLEPQYLVVSMGRYGATALRLP